LLKPSTPQFLTCSDSVQQLSTISLQRKIAEIKLNNFKEIIPESQNDVKISIKA
jgi:hypothetical protein